MYKGSIKPNVGGEKRPPKGVKEVARGGGPPEATMGNKSELALSLLTTRQDAENQGFEKFGKKCLRFHVENLLQESRDTDIKTSDLDERGRSRLWSGKGDASRGVYKGSYV